MMWQDGDVSCVVFIFIKAQKQIKQYTYLPKSTCEIENIGFLYVLLIKYGQQVTFYFIVK